MLTYLNDFTIKKGAVYLLFDTFREFCDSKVGFSCIFLKNKRAQRGSCRTARPDRILGEAGLRPNGAPNGSLTKIQYPTEPWAKRNTRGNAPYLKTNLPRSIAANP